MENKKQYERKVERVFIEAGCEPVGSDYKGLYKHEKLGFNLLEEKGFLKLLIDLDYYIDENKIPFTKINILNLIKAFNPIKE